MKTQPRAQTLRRRKTAELRPSLLRPQRGRPSLLRPQRGRPPLLRPQRGRPSLIPPATRTPLFAACSATAEPICTINRTTFMRRVTVLLLPRAFGLTGLSRLVSIGAQYLVVRTTSLLLVQVLLVRSSPEQNQNNRHSSASLTRPCLSPGNESSGIRQQT